MRIDDLAHALRRHPIDRTRHTECGNHIAINIPDRGGNGPDPCLELFISIRMLTVKG